MAPTVRRYRDYPYGLIQGSEDVLLSSPTQGTVRSTVRGLASAMIQAGDGVNIDYFGRSTISIDQDYVESAIEASIQDGNQILIQLFENSLL